MKKLSLCMATYAIIALAVFTNGTTANAEDAEDAAIKPKANAECEANWQRCNGDIVEICNDKGQYEPLTTSTRPVICPPGWKCTEDQNGNHRTSCVK